MNMHIVIVPDGMQETLNKLVAENRRPKSGLDYFPYAGVWYLNQYFVIYNQQVTSIFSDFKTITLIPEGRRIVFSYGKIRAIFPCTLEEMIKNRNLMKLSLQQLLDCWKLMTTGQLSEPAKIFRTVFTLDHKDLNDLSVPASELCFVRMKQTSSTVIYMLISFNCSPALTLHGREVRRIYTCDCKTFVDSANNSKGDVSVVDTLSKDTLANYMARCFLVEASFC